MLKYLKEKHANSLCWTPPLLISNSAFSREVFIFEEGINTSRATGILIQKPLMKYVGKESARAQQIN